MKKSKGYTCFELAIVLFIISIIGIGGTGYIKNIIKLTQCDFTKPYKAEIIHGIGLLPPVGMIAGWIDVGE